MVLFKVEMTVQLPTAMSSSAQEELKARERCYAQRWLSSGHWRHLWRVAGQYANVSIFEVSSIDELHQILTGLPMYPYMHMTLTALCRHPSSIRDDDR